MKLLYAPCFKNDPLPLFSDLVQAQSYLNKDSTAPVATSIESTEGTKSTGEMSSQIDGTNPSGISNTLMQANLNLETNSPGTEHINNGTDLTGQEKVGHIVENEATSGFVAEPGCDMENSNHVVESTNEHSSDTINGTNVAINTTEQPQPTPKIDHSNQPTVPAANMTSENSVTRSNVGQSEPSQPIPVVQTEASQNQTATKGSVSIDSKANITKSLLAGEAVNIKIEIVEKYDSGTAKGKDTLRK